MFAHLFQLSIDIGDMTKEWSLANITTQNLIRVKTSIFIKNMGLPLLRVFIQASRTNCTVLKRKQGCKDQESIQSSTTLGRVAQSVTCLATDASLTANPGVPSSIRARSHTFVEIDHEIIYNGILLPSAESFKKGRCQLQAKVCARSTG